MPTPDTSNVSATPWRTLSDRLVACLKPYARPVAITFLSGDQDDDAPPRRPDAYPAPNDHGRTGQVPAGCVFWIHGTHDTFSTTAADHANCSVGSLTHGLLTPAEAAAKDDVEAVLASGWVDADAVAGLPRVTTPPHTIVYGPLERCERAPDVVLLRIHGLGLMTLKDAIPEMRIEGKPQCHIIALAKEAGVVAASVGCALSRARTGMTAEEMTCAIPGTKLQAVVETLEATVTLDRQMATYAAHDAQRFA